MKKSVVTLTLLAGGVIAVASLFNTLAKRSTDTVIGAVLPLTGPGALFAEYMKQGIDLAAKDMQKQNIKVYVNFQDSKTNPRQGVEAIQTMLAQKNIKTSIVALSSVAKAVTPIVRSSNMVVIFTAVAIPGVTDGIHTFRLYPDADGMAGVMARHLVREKALRSAAVFYVNDDFGSVSLNAFTKAFESGGGRVVFTSPFELRATDSKSDIAKLAMISPQPDVIYVAGYGPAYGSVIKQIRENGLKSLIAGDMTLGLPITLRQAGSAANGALFVDGTMEPSFIRRFKEEYSNKEPTSYSGYAYDALKALALSQHKNQQINNSKEISASLKQQDGFNGAMGRFVFKENGESDIQFGLFKIQNGQRLMIGKQNQ